MSLFLLFLIFVIVLILMPVFRFARRVNAMRTQFNEMASRARQAYGGERHQEPASAPVRRRKRISRDVGEYVEYEEVAATSRTTSEYHEYTGVVEDQISDVEWEDVK